MNESVSHYLIWRLFIPLFFFIIIIAAIPAIITVLYDMYCSAIHYR